MLEALPVVIPTLRDVARGTLRPPTPADPAAAPETPTGAILLDAAAPDSASLGALYDELELYLQASGIATLRLHQREPGVLEQMLDILAAVTLLRSRGCQQVILIIAAEGAIPRWERSRAETLAGMLEIVRRYHSSSAAELLGAVENLVATIRVVADSVTGVATVLVRAPGLALAPLRADIRLTPRPNRPGHRGSEMSGRGVSPTSPATSAPAGSPLALAISLAAGESTVSALSQLYLWCRALVKPTPAAARAPVPRVDDTSALEERERTKAFTRLHAAGAEFHVTVRWLNEQWSAFASDVAGRSPRPAASALLAAARDLRASTRLRRVDAKWIYARLNTRSAWNYLDSSERLQWLDLYQQARMNKREVAPALAPAMAIERVD